MDKQFSSNLTSASYLWYVERSVTFNLISFSNLRNLKNAFNVLPFFGTFLEDLKTSVVFAPFIYSLYKVNHCIMVDSSTVICWTSLFVTLVVLGQFCCFYYAPSPHGMAEGIEFTLSVCVCIYACVFQNRVRSITSSCMVGFENNLA